MNDIFAFMHAVIHSGKQQVILREYCSPSRPTRGYLKLKTREAGKKIYSCTIPFNE